MDLNKSSLDLLRVARCPNENCRQGVVQSKTQERMYVSYEMAKDAGFPEMEGSIYCDNKWESELCQWCDERRKLFEFIENEPESATNSHC